MRKLIEVVTLLLLRTVVLVPRPARRRDGPGDERGDVPGWVMITVMSAGIVAILTTVAGPELRQMLRDALNSVQ